MVKLPLLCVPQGLLGAPLPLASKVGGASFWGILFSCKELAHPPSSAPAPALTRVSQDDRFRAELRLPTKPAETAPRRLLGVGGI